MSNVSVTILKINDHLELLIRGDSFINREAIANAFEDGLRKLNGVLVEADRTIRVSPSGGFILVCKPFHSDDIERTCSDVRYELQFQLRNPIKTSH